MAAAAAAAATAAGQTLWLPSGVWRPRSQLPARSVTFNGLRAAPCLGQRQPQQQMAAAAPKRGMVVAMAAVTLPVLTFEGEQAGAAELDLRVARAETAKAVVHRGVISEMANKRRGTASTLTRAEVRGGGRKPYKQKGTGRARRGSQRTPLRPGGGVVFGPKPKNWGVKMNRKEKQLAISTAIHSAAVNTVVVEDLDDKFPEPKTTHFLAALRNWGISPSAHHSLLFTTDVSENLQKSSRNVGTFKLLTPRTLTVYDILRADKLVFTKSGVDYLNKTYGETYVLEEVEDDEDEEDDEEEEDEEEEEEAQQ